ncbi:MAG TPA: YciI family protein [Gemmatimonadales bacterium]|nr:YciI family protein [Gemmatimonadales bacterium]
MRFMMLVKADEKNSGPPSPELLAGIDKLVQDVTRSGGELLETGGLLPSAMGAKIRAGRGKLTVTDGPFTEGKELVGGYAIFRFASKKQAIEQGKRFMQLHIDVMGSSYQGELEIRQLLDAPHGG